jgi:hypothetical protein
MKKASIVQLCVTIAFLLTAVGCSERKYVPVSGVVKLNGKPYDKAVVSFQPIATEGNSSPGRGSSAYTDANGRFELFSDENDGAVVGKHLVRIMTRGNDIEGASPEGGSSDETPTNRPIDPIPPEWNALSKIEFEVPKNGTDQANFDIETKTKTK